MILYISYILHTYIVYILKVTFHKHTETPIFSMILVRFQGTFPKKEKHDIQIQNSIC